MGEFGDRKGRRDDVVILITKIKENLKNPQRIGYVDYRSVYFHIVRTYMPLE